MLNLERIQLYVVSVFTWLNSWSFAEKYKNNAPERVFIILKVFNWSGCSAKNRVKELFTSSVKEFFLLIFMLISICLIILLVCILLAQKRSRHAKVHLYLCAGGALQHDIRLLLATENIWEVLWTACSGFASYLCCFLIFLGRCSVITRCLTTCGTFIVSSDSLADYWFFCGVQTPPLDCISSSFELMLI